MTIQTNSVVVDPNRQEINLIDSATVAVTKTDNTSNNTTDLSFSVKAGSINLAALDLTQSGMSAASGAGAIDITNRFTDLTTTGSAQAITIANGAIGQQKTIVHSVDGGSAVLTPTTALGFSTITFTNAGDTATIAWSGALGWVIISLFGATKA